MLLLYLEYLDTANTCYMKPNFMEVIDKWCFDNGVIHGGLLDITVLKEEISLGLIKVGFGIGTVGNTGNFKNLILQDTTEAMSELLKIKQCIMDSYNQFLLIATDSYGVYQWKDQLVSVIIEGNPKYIVSAGFLMKVQKDTYKLEMNGLYSIMDDFVNVDKYMLMF